ncbi:MAG: hypothetical protein H7Z39_15740 [Burkholderiaceae bacterium]|nr:hypothetical protein [Burkholderiaceae bacterium]
MGCQEGLIHKDIHRQCGYLKKRLTIRDLASISRFRFDFSADFRAPMRAFTYFLLLDAHPVALPAIRFRAAAAPPARAALSRAPNIIFKI